MEISDDMDKSWDHPWSTDEMRKKRREWSLAGDAGLLKHLQQFSENLRSKTNKTQETLDALTTRLTETAILIDNVTNTSLALANTQFIESRVQDDDVEIEKKADKPVEESKDQDLATADLIASVSDSVRKGLDIMDEKYRQMEVVDSDSDGEDDGIVLSVILGPNNPYQDRPLPYVIGSDKWNNSTKIGLESSSSESEQLDEEDEESDSDKDDGVFNMKQGTEINVPRLSSPFSESDTYDERNTISHMKNGKLDMESQNIDSFSDSPIETGSKGSLVTTGAPSFAEELAKRLGTVRQAEKAVSADDQNEPSINRLKDDLFAPEEEEDAFNSKADNIFTPSPQLFNNPAPANSWKEKPIKSYKTNIIPASLDVPPPISTVSTKPKSAIDDLFGDADSEDSDNIFSTKKTVKKIPKDSGPRVAGFAEDPQKKHLNLAVPSASNMATSTPEINAHTSNLFSDEEDVADLFSTSGIQREKSAEIPTPSKKKLAGSVSILGNVSASDIQSKALNRMPRAQSSGSSASDTPPNGESTKQSETASAASRNFTFSDSTDDRSLIVQPRHSAEHLGAANESSYSSGISIRPPSSNNTGGSSIGVDFQPQMTSTRLKSEDMYRERIASDSLFAARTRNPISSGNHSNATSNPARDDRQEDTSSLQHDDVFENEDLFGPPPLPKSDVKQPKSKVSSLFDDSDSGDDLFSTPSSGSRSQKSTDFLATTPQFPDRLKSTHRRGLFDEEIDIFGSKDSPDVDIFGITSKLPNTKEDNNDSGKNARESSDNLFKVPGRESNIAKDNKAAKTQRPPKKISLFDDDDDDDDADLFGSKLIKTDVKSESRDFKADDNDLFASNESTVRKESVPVKDSSRSQSVKDDPSDNTSSAKIKNKLSEVLPDEGLFSTSGGSRNVIFEDDDYAGLFRRKSIDENKPKVEILSEEDTTTRKTDQVENKDKEESKESRSLASVTKIGDAISRSDAPAENLLTTNIEQVNTKEDASAIINVTETAKEVEKESKKSPPKTLDIQGDSTGSLTDDNGKGGRRTVSGKIKNLMGKMGEFKILSPMDTPPLWRRSTEKTDEDDSAADRDSDDGGCLSVPDRSSPSSISEGSAVRKQSLPSTASGGSNIETAISFDEPAQVETLSTEASKTRVRIQAKRRPQSRHARKTALRQSGIDFDTVDSSENNIQKQERTNNNVNTVQTNADRLTVSASDNNQRTGDSSISLGIDDKSELGSLSKEISVSSNKNTLLSPSTDEEDLFDVPPDLPEDPQKEDSLFGRAPILSPIDRILSDNISRNYKPLRDTHISGTEELESDFRRKPVDQQTDAIKVKDDLIKKTGQERKEIANEGNNSKAESNEEPMDPLRDSSHDPLEDPSQLFAFVTKTPSPEKGKNLLFSEDDSLFSSGSKKPHEEAIPKKPILDLFADDTEADLFSAPLAKPVKKPLKDTKISLFDDNNPEDDDGSLFGTVAKKPSPKTEPQTSSSLTTARKKTSLFDDDDMEVNLFGDKPEQFQKSNSPQGSEVSKTESLPSISESKKVASVKDIFGDQSSGEDDIFSSKPISRRKPTTKSLFLSDDEDDSAPIFGASSSYVAPTVKTTESRPNVKKAVTRDLKKTAEKIVEDPLSLLQND